MSKILFDEQGLTPGTPFEKDQWKKIATHTNKEIKGFFGEYRFLSNFWPAVVFLDGVQFPCVENAYQSAKYAQTMRGYFVTCSPKEAIIFARDTPLNEEALAEWEKKKVQVMYNLLLQKFDKLLNGELYHALQATGDRYLEETNYWGDVFWGVNTSHKEDKGVGENMLGTLLMKIRNEQNTRV